MNYQQAIQHVEVRELSVSLAEIEPYSSGSFGIGIIVKGSSFKGASFVDSKYPLFWVTGDSTSQVQFAPQDFQLLANLMTAKFN